MNTELLDLARRPWIVPLGAVPAMIRPAAQYDLPAVTRMQHRCTARALLDRYRLGGCAPSPAALDAELRGPHCFVALTPGDNVIAIASVRAEGDTGEIRMLVESKWQQHGLGGALAAHLAGVAWAAGCTELVAHPGTAVAAAQRLMTPLGRSRMVPLPDPSLHTFLTESATLGLGPVRQRLAA